MPRGHGANSSVLSLSRDPTLQHTRGLLLKRTGCTVVAATSLSEFRALLLTQPFDLILLCQSISPEEAELASHFAREFAPSAQLLLMFTRVGKYAPEQADVLLDAHAGPRIFVETAQRMLAGNAGEPA